MKKSFILLSVSVLLVACSNQAGKPNQSTDSTTSATSPAVDTTTSNMMQENTDSVADTTYQLKMDSTVNLTPQRRPDQ
jgi:outer membrane biogenesis lipoprotein LolB